MADIIKALREATGSAGGYLVPDEFAARVYEYIQAKSITLPDLETVNMNHEVMYLPKTTAGTTAYWVAETGTITGSDMQFGRITLTAKKVAALVEVSTEVMEDANVSVANLMVEQMARDLSLKIDNEILNGTGANFSGLDYVGVYNNAVDANGNSNAAIITTAEGTGSGLTGASISLTAVSKAVDQVLADNHDQPDVSYWNPRTIGSLRVLTDGSARPILNQETWGSPLLRDGVVGRIYGANAKTSTQMSITKTYGTASADSGSCADALIGVSKMFGIYGNRRGLVWKTDYQITNDTWKYQTTMRNAFSVKYPESYCIIRAIQN